MKKTTVLMILIIGVLIAYFAWEGGWGRDQFQSLFSGDRKAIDEMALSFMEDIQYKDFKKAAAYHHPDVQKKVNIAKMIRRLFKIKPELLDLMEYRIVETSLDSSNRRGRVKVKARVHVLNTKKIKNPELILYFHKKSDAWFMELQSSLK